MKRNSMMLTALMLLGTGCASNITKMTQPDGITPEKAVMNTERMKEEALNQQADILARKDFNEGMEYLEEAKDDLGEKDEAKEVISDSAYAQAYFKRAKTTSNNKKGLYKDVLSARAEAIKAGAHDHKSVKNKLQEIDSDFLSDTDKFEKTLSATTTAEFQKQYLNIEVLAVQENELGLAMKTLKQMEEKDADDLAPDSFKTAKQSILLAKNKIAESAHSKDGYQSIVNRANEDTIMLYDVMSVIGKNGTSTPESAAIKIVKQERKLGRMKTDMKVLAGVVGAQKTAITAQQVAILSQADKIAFQEAMDNVRNNFSSKEAEVYQQGNSLVIRLKKINFKVGKANIPEDSKNLLTKVSTIVKNIDPSKVVVQGHTDSTGSKAINEKLSENRAQNVADYLKNNGIEVDINSVGFGPNKPLADNQTSQGRALNRRVDVVVTAKDS